MKTIEELQAQHAKELAALTAKQGIANTFAGLGLPVPDYISDSKTHGAIHVNYGNNGQGNIPESLRSMGAAVAMFAQFAELGMVIPSKVLNDGMFTTVHPEKFMTEKMARGGYKIDPYRSSSYAATLRAQYSHDSRNTRAEISFFAMVGARLYAVCVQFGQGYIGMCPKLAPVVKEHRFSSGRRGTGSLESRSFEANENARSMSDALLSFGSYEASPVKTQADHRFLFVADTNESPADCSHAIAQLDLLAEIVDAKPGA